MLSRDEILNRAGDFVEILKTINRDLLLGLDDNNSFGASVPLKSTRESKTPETPDFSPKPLKKQSPIPLSSKPFLQKKQHFGNSTVLLPKF